MIFAAIFVAYGITVVIVEASILSTPREKLRLIPWLTVNKSFIFDCRLCTGFWVSAAVALWLVPTLLGFLTIYGASYFLATQER